MKNKKYYIVYDEKGGSITAPANNKDEAIEAYYEAIKGMTGHQLKICSCYGDKPLDRSKVLKPVKVVEVKNTKGKK